MYVKVNVTYSQRSGGSNHTSDPDNLDAGRQWRFGGREALPSSRCRTGEINWQRGKGKRLTNGGEQAGGGRHGKE